MTIRDQNYMTGENKTMTDSNGVEVNVGDYVEGFTSDNAFIVGCVEKINPHGTFPNVVVSCDMFDNTTQNFVLYDFEVL